MGSASKQLSDYFAEIGRSGGRKSRRALSPEQARRMVRIREARRAYRRFYGRCFWSNPSGYMPGPDDIEWVADRLRKHGGSEGWEAAQRLCR